MPVARISSSWKWGCHFLPFPYAMGRANHVPHTADCAARITGRSSPPSFFEVACMFSSRRIGTRVRSHVYRHVGRTRSAGVAVLCAVMVALPPAPAAAQLLKARPPVAAPGRLTAGGLSLLGGLLNPVLSLLGTTPDPT